jgi:excisionase family DNA binding protein
VFRLRRDPDVTLTEAAALLGVTAATLRQQIANRKLHAVKRGRDWWVTPKEVERYRRESRRERKG